MEAVRLQAAGVSQREVSRRLGIHIRTIESWQKKKLYQETLRTLSGQVTLASVEKAASKVSVEVLEPLKSLEPKEYEGLPDFEFIRRNLRRIASNPNIRESTQVQASLALARLIQMKAELPKHVLEEKEQATMTSELKNLEGMTAEEIIREYRSVIETS